MTAEEDRFNASLTRETRWAFKVDGKYLRPSEIARLSREKRMEPAVVEVIASMGTEQFNSYVDALQAPHERESRMAARREMDNRYSLSSGGQTSSQSASNAHDALLTQSLFTSATQSAKQASLSELYSTTNLYAGSAFEFDDRPRRATEADFGIKRQPKEKKHY
jgi:hypothetical protein